MRQTSAMEITRQLPFHKMCGAGNDFVVVDARAAPFSPDGALVRQLADRRAGIGCDQLLLIGPDPAGEAAFAYRVWNADGDEVEQCGNGARCLALLWALEMSPGARDFSMRSAAGLVEARVANGQAAVSMGVPDFRPEHIPWSATSEAERYTMALEDRHLQIGAVSIGNPHAVIVLDENRMDDVDRAPVTTLGPAVECHAGFPQRANVGFVQTLQRDRIALRVWERGVGETPACGTGACAAVAVLYDSDRVDTMVTVDLPGGSLVVEWHGRGSPIWLSGPSRKIFEGTFRL